MGGETGCEGTCRGLAAVVSALTTSLPGDRGGTESRSGDDGGEMVRTEEGETRTGDGGARGMRCGNGAGHAALASGSAERCTAETAAGWTERPGGGRFEKVGKALVGTAL